jgi:hypothetical protein
MLTRILTFTLFISAFASTRAVQSQIPQPCPKVDIDVARPQGKFFGRGERYSIGAIAHPMSLDTEWRVTWELSPAIAYTRFEDEPNAAIDTTRNDNQRILFVATPDLQSTTVTVKITIDGLPPECPNSKTASFKIQFSEEEPREIVKFPRNISANLQETNLFLVSHSLKRADSSVVALIVVGYSRTDTKRKLRAYTETIATMLTEKYDFPREKIVFAFRAGPKEVAVFGWPLEKEQTLETDTDRLPIPE